MDPNRQELELIFRNRCEQSIIALSLSGKCTDTQRDGRCLWNAAMGQLLEPGAAYDVKALIKNFFSRLKDIKVLVDQCVEVYRAEQVPPTQVPRAGRGRGRRGRGVRSRGGGRGRGPATKEEPGEVTSDLVLQKMEGYALSGNYNNVFGDMFPQLISAVFRAVVFIYRSDKHIDVDMTKEGGATEV